MKKRGFLLVLSALLLAALFIGLAHAEDAADAVNENGIVTPSEGEMQAPPAQDAETPAEDTAQPQPAESTVAPADSQPQIGYCPECGGTPKGQKTIPYDAYTHGLACEHGVIEGRWTISDHISACADRTLCSSCGARFTPDEDTSISHDYDWNSWQADDTYHWLTCRICDEIILREKHNTAKCADRTHCSICGREFTPDENTSISHDYDMRSWESDGTYHWHVCRICGEIVWKSEHSADCTDRTRCTECNAEFVPNETTYIYHDYGDYEHNDTQHWRTCSDCGEIASLGKHYARCMDPNHCITCDAEFVPVDNANTEHSYGAYQHSDTEHWRACRYCGEMTNKGKHSADCTDRTHCRICGAEFTPTEDTSIYHDYDYSEYESDGTYHWRACRNCGEVTNKGKHSASCMDRTHCRTCGAEFTPTEDTYIEHDYGDYEYNDTEHWRTCRDCGVVIGKDSHYARCTNRTHCIECDAEFVPTEDTYISHDYGDYEYNDTEHWTACRNCGEVLFKEKHSADCTDRTHCTVCGAEFVPNYNTAIEHDYDWDNYKHDSLYHWNVCRNCGEAVSRSRHYVTCTDRTHCAECGIKFAVNEHTSVEHDYDYDNYQYDDTYHWFVCRNCGEAVEKYKHSVSCTDRTHCDDCGAAFVPNEDTFVSHYEYDHYEYNDVEHWTVCRNCGEVTYKDRHRASCMDRTHCYDCGVAFVPDGNTEIVHDYNWDSPKHDSTYHWFVCYDCGAQVEKEEHYTYDGDPEGVCSICGYVYAAAPSIPVEPNIPDDTPTAPPAQANPAPVVNKDRVEEEERAYLYADEGNLVSSIAQKLGIPVENADVAVEGDVVTVQLDEASGEYGGSVLRFRHEEEKVLALTLNSTYAPETVQGFDAWRKTIAGADALTSGACTEFVQAARATLSTLLPTLNEEELDELLLAILTSEPNGADLTAEFLTETSNLLGVLEQDGHAFFLFTDGDQIVLGVCLA